MDKRSEAIAATLGKLVVFYTAAALAAPSPQQGSIAGRVLDDQGHAVGAATVAVKSEKGDVAITQAADAEGRFSIAALSAGWYHLTASNAGYVSMELGAATPWTPGRAVIVDGDSSSDLVVRIPRAGTLSGTVLKPDGTPAARSNVQVLQNRLTTDGANVMVSVASSTVGDRGEYHIGGLFSGQYTVSVVPSERASRDGASFATTYLPSSVSETAAEQVLVRSGQERTGSNVIICMVPVANIRGRVTLTTGRFRELSSSDLQLQRTKSDHSAVAVQVPIEVADDAFTIWSVPSGDYTLSARSIDVAGQPISGRTLISIGGGDLHNVLIPLRPSATVTGRIGFSGRGPAPPSGTLRIWLLPLGATSDGIAATTQVRGDGTFVLTDVVPARYRVAIRTGIGIAPWRMTWALGSVTLSGTDIADAGLDVVEGLSRVNLELTDRFGSVSGVLSGDSEVAAHATILAFPSDATLWLSRERRIVTTRPAYGGQFSIRLLPPGNYRLAVLIDPAPNAWMSPNFLEQVIPQSVVVTVNDGVTTVKNLESRRARSNHQP